MKLYTAVIVSAVVALLTCVAREMLTDPPVPPKPHVWRF